MASKIFFLCFEYQRFFISTCHSLTVKTQRYKKLNRKQKQVAISSTECDRKYSCVQLHVNFHTSLGNICNYFLHFYINHKCFFGFLRKPETRFEYFPMAVIDSFNPKRIYQTRTTFDSFLAAKTSQLANVTRLGNLLDFGQVFKPFGNISWMLKERKK